MIKIIKDIKKTLQGDHAQRPDPHHPRRAQHLEPAHQVSQDLSPVISIKITKKRGSCCQGGINCGNAVTTLRAGQGLCEPMSA